MTSPSKYHTPVPSSHQRNLADQKHEIPHRSPPQSESARTDIRTRHHLCYPCVDPTYSRINLVHSLYLRVFPATASESTEPCVAASLQGEKRPAHQRSRGAPDRSPTEEQRPHTGVFITAIGVPQAQERTRCGEPVPPSWPVI